jgi:transcriptional regulator with PAS, ATPase and Fis domain
MTPEMGNGAGGGERTLTAARSSLARAEEPNIPVLFLAGRAQLAQASGAPRFRLLGDELLLGRSADVESAPEPGVMRLQDPLVSGRHARLIRNGSSIDIEDLESKNGTLLQGRRLSGRARLPAGQPFFVGGHALLWRMVSAIELSAMEAESARPLGPVATVSPELAVIAGKLRRWAESGEEVLLLGESGVGKEVYARGVHAASGRSGPFVALNCAALPRDLVESELFGYRPGAHSTARAAKPGLLERAEGGTLFLDEIGEMPQEAQAKLLRFLQDRELLPLGATQPRQLDLRVLAATNRLVSADEPGSLRADLLGRLGAAPVHLPPLRERLEDLGALAAHILERTGRTRSGTSPELEPSAFRALFAYRWPLNVRELEKVLGAGAALTLGMRAIALRDLPPALAAGVTGTTSPSLPVMAPPSSATAPPVSPEATAPPPARKPPMPGPSAEELAALLERHQGNVADVSRALGRQRAAVWRWIKRFGLAVERSKNK